MWTQSLHFLGVMCGLAAGAWLGAAEAPVKLVAIGLSPFLISLCMVSGVFVGRWTLPTLLKGTGYVFRDLADKPHLLAWAVIAGALWAVANTLTVFAIRDVGLSIAFPLWNCNSLVGVFWGWFFFGELRDSGWNTWTKVLGGAVAIVIGAILLGYASAGGAGSIAHRAPAGILAAIIAGLLWGTMYIPYRKAYISGMNPLTFVTVFTVGEMVTVIPLALIFQGGIGPVLDALAQARPALFWLFLGGFCWVVGDLFQQYAAKYIGIGRGIPLSNTNQLWGLAWGGLVFGELTGRGGYTQALVVSGSIIMILGAIAISSAVAPSKEKSAERSAIMRECARYQINFERAQAAQSGEDCLGREVTVRRWWDLPIVAAAVAVFIALGLEAGIPAIVMNHRWTLLLIAAMLIQLFWCGWLLWKRTRFS